MSTNYDDTEQFVMSDLVARTAARENGIRRKMAARLGEVMISLGLEEYELAEQTQCNIDQIRKLLHRDLGGGLELRTIIRAADVLGLSASLFEKTYIADALEETVADIFSHKASLNSVSVVLLKEGKEPQPLTESDHQFPVIYCREEKREGSTIPFKIVRYDGPTVRLLSPISVVVKVSQNGGFEASTVDLQFSVDCAPSTLEAVGFLFRMLALALKEHAVPGGFLPMDLAFGYYLEMV